MTNEELKARLRAFNEWRRGADFSMPSQKQIGEDIDAAIDAIEKLERQLAERDAEIAKLIQAVADHVTVRAEQYAEIAKYRDAPVVAYMHPYGGLLHSLSTGLERETYVIELIVKPGEQ